MEFDYAINTPIKRSHCRVVEILDGGSMGRSGDKPERMAVLSLRIDVALPVAPDSLPLLCQVSALTRR